MFDETKISNSEQKPEVTKFNSPLPFILKLRNLIFGERKPDIYTQITFYLNIAIVTIFGLWSVVSFVAINNATIFLQEKGVDVHALIDLRGIQLGFESGDFVDRLTTFHGISMICWATVFFSLILLWRGKKQFGYVFFVPFAFYFGTMTFYISFTYFLEDTTSFDKICLLIMFMNTLLYVLFHKESDEDKISFFD